MAQERSVWSKALGPPGAALALLLAICLVECASEQRINSRGSKVPNLVEKPNGWRSQRGGMSKADRSCLSYGHSCWGAHGKRSGQLPPQVYPKIPDWYLMKLLRSYSDLKHATQVGSENQDSNAIYRLRQEVYPSAGKLGSDEMDDSPSIVTMNMRGKPEAIPMFDDNSITNAKFLQLMRDATDEK